MPKRLDSARLIDIEIIGEATKALSDDMRALRPEVPWQKITSMRNRLIHQYFGVNLDVVWGVTKDDLPALKEVVAALHTDSTAKIEDRI